MSRYLRATHPFVFDDGEWFVARLAERIGPREAYPRRIYASDLLARRSAELGSPEDWRFDSGRWALAPFGLRGEAVRGRFSAIAPVSLPPAVGGEVAVALRLRHPRGRGTEQGLTLQTWKRDADTHVSVVLRPRKETIALVLTEGGKVLYRETRPAHLRIGKLYRLRLDYDHLGFHVRLGRRSILSAPDRFSTPPSGVIAIQGLNLDVDLQQLLVFVQELGG
jgi:hypothetical protein